MDRNVGELSAQGACGRKMADDDTGTSSLQT